MTQLHFHDLDPNGSGTRQPGNGVGASNARAESPSCIARPSRRSSGDATVAHAFVAERDFRSKCVTSGPRGSASAITVLHLLALGGSQPTEVLARRGRADTATKHNTAKESELAGAGTQLDSLVPAPASRRTVGETSRMALERIKAVRGAQQQAVLELVKLWPDCTSKQLASVCDESVLGRNEYERRGSISKRLSELGQPLPSRPRGLGLLQSYLKPGDRELRWVSA